MRNDKVSEIRKILNQENMDSSAEVNNSMPQDPPEPESTDNELTALQARYNEVVSAMQTQKEEFLRQAAEYENSRKRLTKDKDEVVKYANERLLQDIFPLLDSLEMTLSHVKPEQVGDPLVEGVGLILKQFVQTLTKNGLEEIGNVGDAFDPNLHEAIGTEPSTDYAANHVTRVHRKGYRLKERLVRAALVTVSQ